MLTTVGFLLSRAGSQKQVCALSWTTLRPYALQNLDSSISPVFSHRSFSAQPQRPPPIQQQDPKVVPVFRLASQYSDRAAIQDAHGEYSYRGLLLSSNQLASQVAVALGSPAPGLRVAILCPNNTAYVIAQWATWIGGHTVVPLFHQHPAPVQQVYMEESDVAIILVTPDLKERGQQLSEATGRPMLVIDSSLQQLAAVQPTVLTPPHLVCDDVHEDNFQGGHEQVLISAQSNDYYASSDAMIVFTSGTTGKPKGVVLTHSNLQHQASSLIEAWEINSKDVILHSLPLHHVHGIVNGLLCPLYVGAKCVMMPQFDTSLVWKHLLAIKVPARDRVNIFMAVPTMYLKLLQEYDDIFSKNERMKEYILAACKKNIRLMVCGSASLPSPVFDKWEDATGHRLLERYGMSEIGMALSNPLRGERKPGFVGYPLPYVDVRVAQMTPGKQEYEVLAEGNSRSTRILQPNKQQVEGELLVKGPTVFRCYWNKPKATAKEFTSDGWFRTGDTVQYIEGQGYRVVGRTSVDVIKTGGYKVGALEVERHLLSHPDIEECAVLGIPDITWGHKIAAVVVPKEGKSVILSELREWSKNRMAAYAIPTLLRCVERLPKNAMGKINKRELAVSMFPEAFKNDSPAL